MSRKKDCGTSVYFESKAVGINRYTFIYAGRLDKDREFAKDRELNYVVWYHVADTRFAETVEELERLVLHKLVSCWVVPFSVIDNLCANLKIEKLNSKYGRTRDYPKIYGSGCRLPVKLLEGWNVRNWSRATEGAIHGNERLRRMRNGGDPHQQFVSVLPERSRQIGPERK